MSNSTTKQAVFAKAALLGAALIWGSSFFVFKNALDTVPPNLVLAIRFTTGALILGLLFHKKLRKLSLGDIKAGAVIGLFLFLAYSSQTIGLAGTTPGKNAFLTAVYCVIVPFLFQAVGGSTPRLHHILAAILCILGIGLVSLTPAFTIGPGDLLTLLGGFLFACHMVAIAKLGERRDAIMLTILQFVFAAVYAWIVSLLVEPFPPAAAFSGNVAVEIIYLSVFATAAALLLQNIGQKYTHPAASSLLLSLESVFGVIFSILFYGERLSIRLVSGFVLIFFAILVSETKLSFLRRPSF